MSDRHTESLPGLLVSVSSSWVIRNLFQTGVIHQLTAHFRVVVVTTPVIRDAMLRAGYSEGIEVRVRDDTAEPRGWRYLRQIRKKIYMESRSSVTDRIWARYVRRPAYQRWGSVVMRTILRLFRPQPLLRAAERLDYLVNRSLVAEHLLREVQPRLVLATHASTFPEESILHASDRLGIPVVFMVLSWDHLSSKIVLGSRYRRILVWNDVTAEEIVTTTGWYRHDQIDVVGAPQFDCYAEPPRLSYPQWCREYGLDPRRRTILFSTMPQVRHEQQHVIIESLLREMREGGRLPADTQLLIKCHPFDDASVYSALLGQDYPVGICRNTLPPGASQEQWFPGPEEMYISRDALYFCSCNINIFSTVTLEAAYLDKPIVHVAYDPKPAIGRIPCAEYYKLDHFAPIAESGASKLVTNAEELIDEVHDALANPGNRSARRAELARRYFRVAEGTARDRVVAAIVKGLEEGQPELGLRGEL